MKLWMLLAMAIAVTGCNDCGGLWYQDCPTPGPDATPAPPQPLGTITKILPSAVAGSLGSIDFKDGFIYEYCRGEAAIYQRRIWDGTVIQKIPLDSRLKMLWAVCWDPFNDRWVGTNPECDYIDWNVIWIGTDGSVDGGYKLMGGHSSKWIRNYDCWLVRDFHYGPDSDGYEIKPGQLYVSSTHFDSLFKCEFDDMSNSEKFTEAWWFKTPFEHRASTQTGMTFWCAEYGKNRIVEFNFAPRKQMASPTGRVITLPEGYSCSSLKTNDGQMWAKARKDGQSCILAISLGE